MSLPIMNQHTSFFILFQFLGFCCCQIFQEIPIGMGIGMGMGMPMGMPMMMPMHHQLVGNPYDQGLEIEYSPITQLVSSVAHLFEMHQKSKEREDEHGADHHSTSQGQLFPEFSQLQMGMRGRPGLGGLNPSVMPSSSPKFNLIPYSHGIGSSEISSTSKLINSIPPNNIPPVMWRIGDLIGKQGEAKEKENLYDMTKIKGFPIVKSSGGDMVYRDEKAKNNTNKSWTILEIARKILGVDEIPTASEGNAIAQLIEELRKEKEPKNV